MDRCKVCHVPIGGSVLGWLMRSIMGVRRNSKNPYLCNR